VVHALLAQLTRSLPLSIQVLTIYIWREGGVAIDVQVVVGWRGLEDIGVLVGCRIRLVLGGLLLTVAAEDVLDHFLASLDKVHLFLLWCTLLIYALAIIAKGFNYHAICSDDLTASSNLVLHANIYLNLFNLLHRVVKQLLVGLVDHLTAAQFVDLKLLLFPCR